MPGANPPSQWMLFPKVEEVNRTWKTVVEAVISDRLGPSAKVAPDDGKDERLSKLNTLSLEANAVANE